MKKILALVMACMLLTVPMGVFAAAEDQVVTLTWFAGLPGTVPADHDAMEAKLNELTTEKLGIAVDILYMSNDAIKLALNSGDYYDLAFTCSWFNNYASQANKGLYADITDKVKELTPDLYASIPELVWKGSQVNGKVYAVPVYKDTAASIYWQFKKSVVVDELGLDYTKYTTFESVEEVLKAFKDAHPEQYPINVSKGGIRVLWNEFEILHNAMRIGLKTSAGDTTVVSVFDDPEFLARLATVHSWFENGYINPDAPTLDTYPTDFIVCNQQGYPGADSEWSNSFGFDIVSSKYYGPTLSTTSIRGAMNAVNAASNHVDEALKYLEFINTDTQARDILAYGVEGVHFQYANDNTQVEVLNNNYQPWIWAQANRYTMTPAMPTTVALLNALKAENDEAALKANAAIIGFTFDASVVEAELAACTTIMEKYVSGLVTGATDPAEQVPALIQELERAGYRDVITECQRQLDAYVAGEF